MQINASIDSGVNPADAYRVVMYARGTIAAMLRHAATVTAEWNLIQAERDPDGWARHRLVKAARDTRKRIRRMEIKRNGWVKR